MKDSQRVVILGGTGNGLVFSQIIKDIFKSGGKYELMGFLNDDVEKGALIEDTPVLGKTTDWQSLDQDIQFVFAILSVGKMKERSNYLLSLNIPKNRMATLIHPTAVVSEKSHIEEGCVIFSHVTIQPKCRIGANSIVRAGANLGHDVTVQDYVDIGPNSTLCGYAKIENYCHVAANSVVRDSITVRAGTTVGAGSVILKDTDEDSTWLGNPSRRVS